jgi:hypothetical protein
MHLGMCRHCRAYLKQMKATMVTLGKLPSDPIPPDVQAELLRRFRDMRPEQLGGGSGPESGPAGRQNTRGSV